MLVKFYSLGYSASLGGAAAVFPCGIPQSMTVGAAVGYGGSSLCPVVVATCMLSIHII